MEMLRGQWSKDKFLTVSLDPRPDRMPPSCTDPLKFNLAVAAAIGDSVCCFQLDPHFYYQYGCRAWEIVRDTVEFIKNQFPEVPVIIDAKMASTQDGLRCAARLIFDEVGAQAVTVDPFMGREALMPFLRLRNRGVIVLCRTSNPGADEFQDVIVEGRKLYRHIAWRVSQYWNDYGNCALLIGANYPAELRDVRETITQADRPVTSPIFIPGVGFQGSGNFRQDIKDAVQNGQNTDGNGFSIICSRTVLYASVGPDFSSASRVKVEEANRYVNEYRVRSSANTLA